ncbi:transketolase [Paractinoplanes atraurantiacus]|uniref:Transketolase n=1 Tax=Paractinoplanes atraurantiacus TaxID=1036182 RepID=A0A285KCT2_9ACTN|nr:transketolase [Actinoplanes atraurantiacus]SNY70415.1 transketolase [Actinoplanes atraurantiacus]
MLVADPTAAAAWHRFRQDFAGAAPQRRREMLRQRANQSRTTDLQMIGRAGLGHVGGDMSVLDILTTLFFAVLRVDPEKPEWADRDRFVLSKGHTAGALYATLAAAGFFPAAELDTFAGPLSALNGHPNRVKVPGVETNTGPLGHGLPVSVGMAVAARLASSSRHVYVVLGDGELQEGSNWEAAMTAGHRRLANLTAVVDRNRLQQGARTEETNGLDPLDAKWKAFGWDVAEVDGHDHLALLEVFTAPRGERPLCVIANTTKGRGVSFMEDRVEWHHKVPSAAQIEAAAVELAR